MVIRVLITDDHSVVREGLRMFLQCDPDLTVGGTLTLESVPGQGTGLSVLIPLEVGSEVDTFTHFHL